MEALKVSGPRSGSGGVERKESVVSHLGSHSEMHPEDDGVKVSCLSGRRRVNAKHHKNLSNLLTNGPAPSFNQLSEFAHRCSRHEAKCPNTCTTHHHAPHCRSIHFPTCLTSSWSLHIGREHSRPDHEATHKDVSFWKLAVSVLIRGDITSERKVSDHVAKTSNSKSPRSSLENA